MSGDCPSCPPDVPGNMPCAAPFCPRSVESKDLVVPIPFPLSFEPGHDEWMAMGAPVKYDRYERACVEPGLAGERWYWRKTT